LLGVNGDGKRKREVTPALARNAVRISHSPAISHLNYRVFRIVNFRHDENSVDSSVPLEGTCLRSVSRHMLATIQTPSNHSNISFVTYVSLLII
jgi:hypothetical protein